MVSRKLRFLFQVVLCAGLTGITSTVTLAQSESINWQRMQRDLDIMEGVLNKLLTSHPSVWGGNTRGVYFDGYGIIFQVDGYNQALNVQVLYENAKKASDKVRERVKRRSKNDDSLVIVNTKGERVEDYELALAEKIDTLKERCVEFLGNYADAIGQVKPNDRITILVNLNSRGSAFYTIAGAYAINAVDQPSILEVTAKKSDIIAYRHGGIASEAFQQRIVVNQTETEERMQQNIDIMSQIMDTALSRKYQEDFSVSKNRGIYVKGLGALFFVRGDIHTGLNARAPAILKKYLSEPEVNVSVRPETKSSKKPKEILENFKSALVEIVADYGHTLRTLASEEHVVVSVAFNRWDFDFTYSSDLEYSSSSSTSFSLPNHFVLKASKHLLDKYSRGQIKLAELQKSIDFQEY